MHAMIAFLIVMAGTSAGSEKNCPPPTRKPSASELREVAQRAQLQASGVASLSIPELTDDGWIDISGALGPQVESVLIEIQAVAPTDELGYPLAVRSYYTETNGRLDARLRLPLTGSFEITVTGNLAGDKTVEQKWLVTNHNSRYPLELTPPPAVANDRELVATVQSLIEGKATEREKLSAIYDWIRTEVRHTDYKYPRVGQTRSNDTSLQVFYERNGVCSQQAELLTNMARLAGIPARHAHGKTSQGDHAWAELYVDGRWISADVTWDGCMGPRNDPKCNAETLPKPYFLDPPQERFTKSHQRYEACWGPCTLASSGGRPR